MQIFFSIYTWSHCLGSLAGIIKKGDFHSLLTYRRVPSWCLADLLASKPCKAAGATDLVAVVDLLLGQLGQHCWEKNDNCDNYFQKSFKSLEWSSLFGRSPKNNSTVLTCALLDPVEVATRPCQSWTCSNCSARKFNVSTHKKWGVNQQNWRFNMCVCIYIYNIHCQ